MTSEQVMTGLESIMSRKPDKVLNTIGARELPNPSIHINLMVTFLSRYEEFNFFISKIFYICVWMYFLSLAIGLRRSLLIFEEFLFDSMVENVC